MKTFFIGASICIAFIAGVQAGEKITLTAVREVERAIDIQEEIAQVRVLARLMNCESSFRPTVIGDGGKSVGILQFQQRTFHAMAAEAGMQNMNWHNPEDQMALAWWALRNGKGGEWTCYEQATAF